eukprot:Sspe_Gene.25693::Locus_10382_Transcript_1_1_Confidence_1.000_Length_1087::g.25693::m.25693
MQENDKEEEAHDKPESRCQSASDLPGCPRSDTPAAASVASPRRVDAVDATQRLGELPDEEIAILREIYNNFEKTESGISKDFLPKLLTAVNSGVPPSISMETLLRDKLVAMDVPAIDFDTLKTLVHHWYRNVDLGRNGGNGGTEFSRIPKFKKPQESADRALVLKTFSRYDKDGTGVIRLPELREMMTDLNSGLCPTDQEVQHVMWFADTSQRGCLNLQEFESAVTFWYIHTMEERERAKSHCCSVL